MSHAPGAFTSATSLLLNALESARRKIAAASTGETATPPNGSQAAAFPTLRPSIGPAITYMMLLLTPPSRRHPLGSLFCRARRSTTPARPALFTLHFATPAWVWRIDRRKGILLRWNELVCLCIRVWHCAPVRALVGTMTAEENASTLQARFCPPIDRLGLPFLCFGQNAIIGLGDASFPIAPAMAATLICPR